MARAARIVGSLIFVSSLVCLAGFWWGRTSGHEEVGVRLFGQGLLWTFYAAIAAIALLLLFGAWTFVRVRLLGVEDAEGEPPRVPRE